MCIPPIYRNNSARSRIDLCQKSVISQSSNVFISLNCECLKYNTVLFSAQSIWQRQMWKPALLCIDWWRETAFRIFALYSTNKSQPSRWNSYLLFYHQYYFIRDIYSSKTQYVSIKLISNYLVYFCLGIVLNVDFLFFFIVICCCCRHSAHVSKFWQRWIKTILRN